MNIQSGLIGGFVLAASVALTAQSPPPPVNGVNSNMAIEGTTNAVYRALNVVVVKTIDGVEHMIHYTKDLLVHGGKGKDTDRDLGDATSEEKVVVYDSDEGGRRVVH